MCFSESTPFPNIESVLAFLHFTVVCTSHTHAHTHKTAKTLLSIGRVHFETAASFKKDSWGTSQCFMTESNLFSSHFVLGPHPSNVFIMVPTFFFKLSKLPTGLSLRSQDRKLLRVLLLNIWCQPMTRFCNLNTVEFCFVMRFLYPQICQSTKKVYPAGQPFTSVCFSKKQNIRGAFIFLFQNQWESYIVRNSIQVGWSQDSNLVWLNRMDRDMQDMSPALVVPR